MWDQLDAPWRLDETYALIHRLQPQTLIGSNHHRMPIPGEDFQMFERDLPGQNTMGFNQTGIGALPLETCETMNGSWGFNIKDTQFKSTEDLIHMLVRAAGQNSNLLLNTGPMPNGKIQAENIQTLKEMGRWMELYGESISGTRGGPAGANDWGVTTIKDNKIYVHVLNAGDAELYIPTGEARVKNAINFDDGSKVRFNRNNEGVLLTLPDIPAGKMDHIIVLEM